jgi:hypothetical protein
MFESIAITWGGQEYVIAPNRVLGAIGIVEEQITLVELSKYVAARQVPAVSKVAKAYAGMLQYCNAKVTADEVYLWMISDPSELAHLTSCLNTILAMMLPDSATRGATSETARPIPAVVKSSRKRTRR